MRGSEDLIKRADFESSIKNRRETATMMEICEHFGPNETLKHITFLRIIQPAAAKYFQMKLEKLHVTRMCSMSSHPGLVQQEQWTGVVPKEGNELLKTLGRSTVSIKKGPCLMPLNALPGKHVVNSQWTDFPENIMSMTKKDLRIKRSATEVVFNGNNYLLDFFHIMLLDLKSGMQQPIA
ncbi:hypothetical protein H5410_003204 [Solanum commersonii]|uniref:RCD1 WWE domain-containing protein n=1 Tax=Solanum commersonii TaxID=4109 RepID=A0A9J6B504_SOLCO|nr:hypothetical protein H5410_003204 [Solanum commersonii]